MKMSELKKFLQDRGITVNSYLKPGLVAIGCAVEEMNLPLQSQTTRQKKSLILDIVCLSMIYSCLILLQ